MFSFLKSLVALPFEISAATLRNAADILDITEDELIELIESGEVDIEELKRLFK